MKTAATILLAMAMATIAVPAAGCSMVPGYKVPTNLELAAKAEVIVVAEVTSSVPGKREHEQGDVVTRPVALLKGAALPGEVVLSGATITDDSRWVVASKALELRAANPGALIGGCVRYMFGKGMKLVLFLARDAQGALVPFRSAFSRDAEDVPNLDALWVKAVREYAAIGSAPRSQWTTLLKARIAALRATPGDADAMAIAADMAVELKGRRLLPFD